MIWELLATVFSGLGAAGLVMGIRVFFKRLPKWFVPAGAGLGMLFFQVYSEYTWFDHTRSLLPASTVVVAEAPETAFYKPWTYYQPQILKFIAVDATQTVKIGDSGQVLQTNLYFFERRMSAKTLPVVIDCQNQLQTHYLQEAELSDPKAWGKTEYTDKIVQVVCPKK